MIHTVARRNALYERLPKKACVLVFGASHVRRNGENSHLYRQSSDLLFLTGITEPDVIAVFTPSKTARFTVLCRPRDREAEIWFGPRMGLEGAVQRIGADAAFELGERDRRLFELLDGCDEVHYLIGETPEHDALVARTIARLRRNERNGSRAPSRIVDLDQTLHELRCRKDDHGIACLRKSCAVTIEGQALAAAATVAGKRECEIAALVEYAFRRQNGVPGFSSIVAAGENATHLHYVTGEACLQAGQLLLVDVGCEIAGFTGDVTRTYPVPAPGSRPAFSAKQQALYEAVLAAQLAGIAAVKPGSTVEAIHNTISLTLATELRALALLEEDPLMAVQLGHLLRFYPHRSSHFLGMDVHDVGRYFPGDKPRPLEPGHVITIEPGLYIQPDDPKHDWRGLAVRIEDDVLVTTEGCEVLTSALPKQPAELLKLVSQGVTFHG